MTLLNFFKKKQAIERSLNCEPCSPDKVVNVVGDVHGCFSLLKTLFEKLDKSEHIVFVGDYVDRGEKSADVLYWLREQYQEDPDRVTCLMGNHELMMIQFLEKPIQHGPRWLAYGGLQTLASFGVPGAREIMQPDELVKIRDHLKRAMPDGLENWLRSLPASWSSGNLWVVHAGADPSIPMTRQDDRTFVWGCSSFLEMPRADGCWVAHGHTVIDPPEQRASRISVDTGAYHSGRLTAARCLRNGEVYFIQATGKP